MTQLNTKRSPLGLHKTPEKGRAKWERNTHNKLKRAELQAEKAREGSPEKRAALQAKIDMISKGK